MEKINAIKYSKDQNDISKTEFKFEKLHSRIDAVISDLKDQIYVLE